MRMGLLGSVWVRLDPRTQLLIALLITLVAFQVRGTALLLLPLLVFPTILLTDQLRPTCRLIRRLLLPVAVLFVVNLYFLGHRKAGEFALRIVTVASAFAWVSVSMTSETFCLALTRCGLSFRYAFPFSLALQQVPLTLQQLRLVRDAHRMRGRRLDQAGWRSRIHALRGMATSAVVMAVRRAWEMTEVATLRGFDSRVRRPRRQLAFTHRDLMAVLLCLSCLSGVVCYNSQRGNRLGLRAQKQAVDPDTSSVDGYGPEHGTGGGHHNGTGRRKRGGVGGNQSHE